MMIDKFVQDFVSHHDTISDCKINNFEKNENRLTSLGMKYFVKFMLKMFEN